MEEDYYNKGWFGQHPAVYEIGSFFIAPLRRRAARLLGGQKQLVLDIATGTGAQALEIAKLGHDVTGIDLDKSMLEKAASKCCPELALRFLHADGTALPFPDHSFDSVSISFAMHDVPHDIGLRILSDAKRVLKADGVLLIVDYNELGINPGAWLLNLAAKFYESPNYFPFVKTNIHDYLEHAGFQLFSKTTFLGAVQFTLAKPSLA